ncbi:hypothetical protein HT576_08975 [Haloterrigena sp. SYSU A121-1]|uniref:Uncharacterized protein n=1 Tax=Haloterrigena gelatinilytica TaxID=2741724 RepID=A0A8J8KEF0_9EURY|nr:hypothetical protein [Haloterrigena gelatinilytica]NUB91153.1 hypothetical protein [Haloterrigena gelatinilytica]
MTRFRRLYGRKGKYFRCRKCGRKVCGLTGLFGVLWCGFNHWLIENTLLRGLASDEDLMPKHTLKRRIEDAVERYNTVYPDDKLTAEDIDGVEITQKDGDSTE